jgi:hypothetical protein
MYMDGSEIAEPPEVGWDTIDPNGWPNFDKTEEVVELLRHLPYINQGNGAQGAANCDFMDWHTTPADMDGEDIREATEPHPDDATIPSHIVGLTIQSEYDVTFLFDTELGVIYWHECQTEAKSAVPEVEDDPYDWVDDDLIPEDQVEWRAGSGLDMSLYKLYMRFMLTSHTHILGFGPLRTSSRCSSSISRRLISYLSTQRKSKLIGSHATMSSVRSLKKSKRSTRIMDGLI